jgi:Domain of unknown function (DUF1848)
MIISASYKTDIPTFYGEWFIRRLCAGYCKTVNPYNKQISRISLRPEDVEGFVFWTKNISPFLKHLAEVHARHLPFVVQHTITGYPGTLEQSVVDAAKSVENVHRVAGLYGPKVCVWRYDTIVLTSLTSREFHLDTFERLAKALAAATDEVVVSFAHIYKKTLRNMNSAAREFQFTWTDPDEEWKRNLLAELVAVATSHGMRLTVCSQPQFLVPCCGEARCIDAERLAAVAGRAINAKEKGNRAECRCSEAKDIGEYDTCPHGCVYCYSVLNRPLALRRYRAHDPTSEFLFPPPEGTTRQVGKPKRVELSLFDEFSEQ